MATSAESSPKECGQRIAGRATKAVNVLFFTVLAVLIFAAIAISVGVYFYTRGEEEGDFEAQYEADASKLVSSFRDAVERKLGAMNNFANSFTSFALATNSSFPNVTLPHFAVRGQDLRIAADSYVVHWLPLVTDETREAWEQYSFENRHIFDTERSEDVRLKAEQDETYFGPTITRSLQATNTSESSFVNETLADDGSGFHLKIWNFGSLGPRGDMPHGRGAYLPLWQSSPINPTTKIINMDFSNTRVAVGILPVIQESRKAVLYKAVVPIASGRQQLEANLGLSQYRHEIDDYLNDPATFLGYPVFDSFDGNDKNLAGVLITPLYWRLVLSNSLSPMAKGIICVLQNSFNETLSYRIDGPKVTFLGTDDYHDPKFNEYELSQDVNAYLEQSASPTTRSYTTVPLHEEFGVYEVRVYPSQETKEAFTSRLPVGYSLIVAVAFVVPTLIFMIFAYVVERRQRLVMQTALVNAKQAVETERELNEYLSHEVRNPLAAAISACTFVSCSMNDPAALQILSDSERMVLLRKDLNVIESSLTFINDILRSMLDLHRSNDKKLQLNVKPVDIVTSVIEPVRTMLATHDAVYDVLVDCPQDLVIMTDALRVKQVLANLAINSSKFVTRGFIRIRAEMKGKDFLLSVEDSGPGIPLEKHDEIFQKFQTSLDVLSQGTGLGLNLCASLADTLGGSLRMDKTYNSGIEGCPGTRFVLQLNEVEHSQEDSERSQENGEALLENTSSIGTPLSPNFVKGGEIDQSPSVLPDEYSVLFVDDDQILRKLFLRAVKKVTPMWTIKEASNGETAIRMNEEEHFDLIFMDQYMASVEKQKLGTQTIRELRSKGVDSIICGLSANYLEEEFRRAGADHFLLKPIPCKTDELLKVLLSVTEEKTFADSESDRV